METRENSWSGAMRAERAGDSVAYERFLGELAASLRRIVMRQLRRHGFSDMETEDIVQDVLIAIHLRRDQWDPARPLLPWLNAITRYKIIDASRRLRRGARVRIELADDAWETMATKEPLSPDRNARDTERLIAQLPRGEQAVIRAMGVEGASAREAALQLGSTEGAVRVAFHRSLKRLMAIARGKV